MKETIDESIYTRVTTPLNRYSGLENIPINILSYAADRGTRVHQYCEMYANQMLFGEIDPDCFEYVQAFVTWFDENVLDVISTETRYFHEDLKIQGQIDMIAKVKGMDGLTVIDIKTSSKYCKTWPLQTAAYQSLCWANKLETKDKLIIQLCKDGSSKSFPFLLQDHCKDMSLYVGILEAYRYFL